MVVAPPSTYLAHTDAFLFYSVETQKQQILPNVCSQQMENVGEKTWDRPRIARKTCSERNM